MFTAARGSKGAQQHTSDALSLLDKAVLEMITAQQPLLSVLETLCIKIEELAPDLSCSIVLLDQDKGVFEHAVGPGLPRSYLDALKGIKIGPNCGSCGTAAYLRRAVIVPDIA